MRPDESPMWADKYQDYMYGLIKRVVEEIGPRPACSEAEKRLGRLLVGEWKPACNKVDVEPFTCSPTAFIGSIPLSALLYFAAVTLYWFLPPAALAIGVLGLCTVVLEVFQRREFVDFLFPRKQGENVVGIIQPAGQTRQRVVVSGHMDSAYEFNLFLHLKSAFNWVVAAAFAAELIAIGGCLANTMAYFGVFTSEAALTGVGIAMIALSPIVGLFLVFTFWRPVPGASDNMSAVAVVAGLGKCLGEARRSGTWYPESTEVVLLATSSEEASMRGADRFVKRHLKELKAIPTYVLCLEMIRDERFPAVLTGESATGAKHDTRLVRLAQEVGASHKRPVVVGQLPRPHGTDAAPFSLNGIAATCVACDRLGFNDPTYHTRYDTYDRIRPQALSVTLQMVLEMIEQIDKA